MPEQNIFPVFSRKIAYQLREQGFRIVKKSINSRHIEYDVYWFEDTESLKQAFGEIQQNLKKIEQP